MRIATFLSAVFFLSNISFGQNQECVSEPTPSQLQYLNQNSNDRNNWDKPESIIWLPVQNHIIRETPQYLFMRVALCIHRDNLENAFETYRHISNKDFTNEIANRLASSLKERKYFGD